MSTGSFIEMFMTTFGWHLYEIVWGVISSTGLAYLPFFAVIIDNVVKPIESQEAKAAAVTSLRRLEIDIVRLIIMMMLAVSPYMTINYGAVSYTKACQVSTGTAAPTVTAGNSGTIFDDTFQSNLLNNQHAKAPPWFYIVMSVTGGVNDAVISRLPCEINIRQTQYEMSTLNIEDPHVKRDMQRFVTECYEPAVADFYNNRREMPAGMELTDIDWPGSELFNSGFYRNEYAKHQVPGFAFDRSRKSDMGRVAYDQEPPEYGYPSCYDWWTNSTTGLRVRLVEEFPRGTMNKLSTLFASSATKQEQEDAAIRKMLANEGQSVYKGLDLSGNGLESNMGGGTMTDTLYEWTGNVVGMAGAFITELLLQPMLFMVKQMAPYVQATMLMATYFLLPWVLLVGNYEWSTIKTATITIFAMKFWTSIWAVTDLLDNKLAQTLSQASGLTGVSGFFSMQNQMMNSIIDLLILGLYMGLPMYFLSIMGWGGERGASAPTQASGVAANEGKGAGQQGTSLATGAATKSISK
ncbi:conjugal transfer protein TraG N-terminal domain-containing protein [Methylophaga pinxianii]|uniref:conjugal transfer protein TraG N-terminal domain-containing protein n=1 Tax=Methylophaga pinxianii TaxID=2881052 RepID=UPI001CF14C0C|nr:conjugal transfer protein TraG N-terminal domain-containing protein [Methylophaga pinxianii]MCB2425489.1 conjugal transfer protein TraG N-terminal domain-containing protein [Methylophaga pinxianii]UPH47228.1 conjugal transfer protein TraG N-terminal domain-containing protein [Methylophaga pinxianii]